MTGLRRFWTAATVVAQEDGFAIALDARPLMTPAKRQVRVPGRGLADALAAEWAAAGATVDPRAMPLTRAVNVTIDRVSAARAEVAAMIAAYGESDLLCHRAPHPPALSARQAAAWDPLLDWAAARFGARLATATGVMPLAQPPEALARLRAAVAALSPWALTPLHEAVTLTGSLLIGLALREGHIGADDAWAASRIDEDWQVEQWGEDAEAAAAAARRHADFRAAARLMRLLAGDADGRTAAPAAPAAPAGLRRD